MLCKITPDSSGLPRYEDRSKFLRIHPITHPMVTRKYLLAPLLCGSLPAFAVFLRGAGVTHRRFPGRPWPTAFWLSIRKLHRCRTGRRGAGAGRWRELSHRCGTAGGGAERGGFLAQQGHRFPRRYRGYESPKLTERPRSASVPWSPRAVTEKCNFTEPEVRPWRILRSS